MSDLDLPVRDRTYVEPSGPHVVLVRGRNLQDALEHVAARPDCRALAVIGCPEDPPDLSVLARRRLLVTDGRRHRMRALAEAGIAAGAEVEWFLSDSPPVARLAAWALPVGAVILAAGTGSRMGQDKLLLEVDGRPMVLHATEAASLAGCHELVAVYSNPAVKRAIGDRARCVYNPAAATGMASSVKRGLQTLGADMAAAVVLLGDQPLVGARTVEVLLREYRREGARPAVAAGYGGEAWRPPVVLDRSLWSELMEIAGDAGARQLLAGHPDLVDVVPAPGRPDDIDTPEDYANIVRLFPSRPPAPR
jgi:CTP:molybdopterin cytidylyltransferase MocA